MSFFKTQFKIAIPHFSIVISYSKLSFNQSCIENHGSWCYNFGMKRGFKKSDSLVFIFLAGFIFILYFSITFFEGNDKATMISIVVSLIVFGVILFTLPVWDRWEKKEKEEDLKFALKKNTSSKEGTSIMEKIFDIIANFIIGFVIGFAVGALVRGSNENIMFLATFVGVLFVVTDFQKNWRG